MDKKFLHGFFGKMWCSEITLEELNKSVFIKVQQNQRNQPQPFSLAASTIDRKTEEAVEQIKG